jgi:hypothetical protein
MSVQPTAAGKKILFHQFDEEVGIFIALKWNTDSLLAFY